MDNLEPQLTFFRDTAMTTGIGVALASLAAVAGGMALVPAITKRILPKPQETHLSDFLPYEGIKQDGTTILLKNGYVCRYLFISGRDQSFMDYSEALAAAKFRKDFLDGISEIGVTVRIHTIRKRVDLSLLTGFPNPLAEEISRKWNEQFSHAYKTLNIICITAKNEQRLDDAQQVAMTALNTYDVQPVTQSPDDNPGGVTIGSILGEMVSPVTRPNPKGIGLNLSDVISADVVWFRPDGIIEFHNGTQRRYASAIGIKKIGDEINSNLTTELLSLPLDMNIIRYVQPMSKAEALIRLEQHGRLASATSFNAAVANQFEMARAMVEGMDDNYSSLCAYCSTIFIYGDTIEEVRKGETVIRTVVAANGSTPVRETGASQASWFLQFPTMDLLPRPYKLFTYNIAFDYTLDKPARGLSNSDWGKGPICAFKTESNTVYQHQFHISEEPAALGHGVVIAPTGSGKTVLMEFLSMMSSRHKNVKHFFFDRYRGTAIYTEAMKGKYLSLNSEPLPWSVEGGMNPFDCEDTPTNRSFLKDWISGITKQDDEEAMSEISDAVDVAFETLEREDRSLASIHEALFGPTSEVRTQLKPWVNRSQYGNIFNADQDSIDLDGSWLTAFDMTTLLDDPNLGGATISYLMHKIRTSMMRNNNPGFIFIDETEPLLRNESFLRLFKVALQEFRKIRGVVISVFQRPEALRASNVSELVRQQSGTFYLFQNPGAKLEDYAEFQLNEKEAAFVLGRSSASKRSHRSILLKVKRHTGWESVIVDVNLAPLGPHLRLFSSSSSDVSLASKLYRQYGDKWVETYLTEDAP